MTSSFLKSPDFSSRSLNSSNGGQRSPTSERRIVKDHFSRLDANSKVLIQTGMERLKIYSDRQKDKLDPITREEEESYYELLQSIRDIHIEMKNVASDMSTVQMSKILSPRVVDQIKTWNMVVEGLHGTLRQLQMDFRQVLHRNQKEDLLSLSRSPFEEDSRTRRRRGADDISAGVTDSLLHSRQILLETVQQSSGTLGVLAQSSGNVTTNLDELRDQNTVVGYSRKLLGKYGRREWTDKILICMALIFFFSVVFYVTQKRIF